MSYKVLARKYRPTSFDEVVGQTTVTRTLQNALERGQDRPRVPALGRARRRQDHDRAHPRQGAQLREGRGADREPLLDAHEETARGLRAAARSPPARSLDVQEIDGATNNGVDQVRELRESARYSPARDRFKVWIIDEVHMLSTARRSTRS